MKKRFIFLCLLLNQFFIGHSYAHPKPPVIKNFQQWLAQDRNSRPNLADQTFASRPLTRKQAALATKLLLQDQRNYIKNTWAAAWEQKEFESGPYQFKYEYKVFGKKPQDGRSLYISLHGGGGTTAAVNDQQWRNQIKLYTPSEGIYVAPRAPTDTWNMWHQDHIDGFLHQLIQAAIVFEDVNPNKVYVLGYSAGGDGVFQLAPRMADYWAAAAMMAGHPGDATALNLRNIGFTIHMGGKDAAYKRNELAKKWAVLLDSLKQSDPEGFAHEVQIHQDRPHWMNRQDTAAITWMAKFKRNALPQKVVWQQDDVVKERFYWLGVPASEAKAGRQLIATLEKNRINILKTDYDTVLVNLNDAMLNLNKPITVHWQGEKIFRGKVKRSLLFIWQSVEGRNDENLLFNAQLFLSNKKVISTALSE
ncbi:MAG: hypothetical protein ACO1OF_18345 [Adhaeribacter sp.]